MINKDELLNEIYKLERFKQPNTFSFMRDFETVSLYNLTELIEETDATSDAANEEVDIEELMYNVIHTMADFRRGLTRALNELTEGEKVFVLKMLETMRKEG